jgi:GTPase SAR1 family protein
MKAEGLSLLSFSLQWNTAGEERFRSLGKLAFRGALVAIIVFDFTASSFAEVETWAKSARDTSKNITVILVGNEKGVKHEVSNLEIRVRPCRDCVSYGKYLLIITLACMTGSL